uniref:Replicase n=1 Tax=Insect-associated tymovirus 2 TaxID=2692395 RepID=A0A6B9KT08_9VIRU|nr:replicase [Insect-associated tymovirus 2]
MDYGFSTSPRRPCGDLSQGLFPAPSPRVGPRLPTGLTPHIPLRCPKDSPSLSSVRRHSNFRPRQLLPPSPDPQNPGDQPSPQSLASSSHLPIRRGLHEATEVSKASAEKSQLLFPPQLPPHSGGHSPLSGLLPTPPYRISRVSSRRANVLRPLPSPRLVRQRPKSYPPVRKSRGSPRERLHKSLSPPRTLPVQHHSLEPPLHSGGSSCRFIQPAHPSHPMAENQFHSLPESPALSHHPGKLGPPPLSSNPARTPSYPRTILYSKYLLKRDPRYCILRSSPGLGTAEGHLSPPAPSRQARARTCLQRPFHLHQGRSDSPNVRPRRIRPNPVQQARVPMGYSQRLGQSPNLRAPQRASPSERAVSPSSQPMAEVKAVPFPALATDRRRVRSFPILPNPPAALPPVLYTSTRGKCHFRLPSTISTPTKAKNQPPANSAHQAVSSSSPASPSQLSEPTGKPPSPPTQLAPQSPRESVPVFTFSYPKPLQASSSSNPRASSPSRSLHNHEAQDAFVTPPSSPPRLLGATSWCCALPRHRRRVPPTATRHLPSPPPPRSLPNFVGTTAPLPTTAHPVSPIHSTSSPRLVFQSSPSATNDVDSSSTDTSGATPSPCSTPPPSGNHPSLPISTTHRSLSLPPTPDSESLSPRARATYNFLLQFYPDLRFNSSRSPHRRFVSPPSPFRTAQLSPTSCSLSWSPPSP